MGADVVLGQLASSSAFAGVDSAAHMAEEVCCSLSIILSTITHDAAGVVLPLFGTDDPTGVSSCPSW
jgi:hypothetical protein